jgi:hypothetical protein
VSRMDDRLAQITAMTSAQLPAEWQTCFGEVAPTLPLSLLRRALAYRVQELAHGGLPAAAKRMLDALARDSSASVSEPAIRLKTGTRLLREWKGRVHAVLVMDEGFMLDGERHASLSEIARKITGARWSGPRFFGLKRRPPPPSRKEAVHG